VVLTDYTVLVDATSGAITVNLPSASTAGEVVLNIKKIDATSNNVTIDPASTETIDGVATYVLKKQWNSVSLQCNGVSWFIL